MRRRTATIGPAATALLLAGGLLSTTTTAGATSDPRPLAGPTVARLAPGAWQQVSTEKVQNFTEPGTFLTADGVLHVAWGTTRPPAAPGEPYTDAIVHRSVLPSGGLGAETDVVAGLSYGTAIPEVTGRPGGIRVYVSALKATSPPERDASGIFAYGSDLSGASWTEEGTASTSDGDFAATTFDDGTPMIAGLFLSGGAWRTGFGEHPASGTISSPAFGAMEPQLARSGATVVVGFQSFGDATTAGIGVQQLLPTPGPPVQAPGSCVGYHFQGPGMATRADGTIWAAYPTKASAGAPLLLWQVGSRTTTTVPGSERATWFDLGAGPDGRLWLVWGESDGTIRMTRTATSGTRFGAVTAWRPPADLGGDYGMTIEPAASWADVLLIAETSATVTSRVWHTRMLPGLDLSASPSRWRARRAQRVRVRVTDAGIGVRSVRVRGGGASCRTDRAGRCTLRFAPRRPGRVNLRATAAGWVADSVVLRVKR